eukprot:4618255-Prymnesium_polylepis.1
MSRQQGVMRVWTRARGTARLRRAERRGPACGRAGHAGIARGADGRGPALRHSCVFSPEKSSLAADGELGKLESKGVGQTAASAASAASAALAAGGSVNVPERGRG